MESITKRLHAADIKGRTAVSSVDPMMKTAPVAAYLPIDASPGRILEAAQMPDAGFRAVTKHVRDVRKAMNTGIDEARATVSAVEADLVALASVVDHLRDGSPISPAVPLTLRAAAASVRAGVLAGTLPPVTSEVQSYVERGFAKAAETKQALARVARAGAIAVTHRATELYETRAKDIATPLFSRRLFSSLASKSSRVYSRRVEAHRAAKEQKQ